MHLYSKQAKAIAEAIEACEFDVHLTDSRKSIVQVHDEHSGPRIEVRHPQAVVHGRPWLVAIIGLDPTVQIRYAVPIYRPAIVRTLRRLGHHVE